jgi:hypothetical protein
MVKIWIGIDDSGKEYKVFAKNRAEAIQKLKEKNRFCKNWIKIGLKK